MGEDKPKFTVQLLKIKDVGVIDEEEDAQKYSKLKSTKAQEKYFKVTFFRDGRSKGGKDTGSDDGDQDPDNDDLLTWYFQCDGSDERDRVISQIYINCGAKWESQGRG